MLCWPSWLRIMILLNGFLLAHQILFQRTEKKGKKPYNCSRIGIWWSFNILTFCVFMLNPSPCCLSWRKLSAISHKDVFGWRTQLTLCLLIISLDLSEGRGSEVESLTGSNSLANQAQMPLQKIEVSENGDVLLVIHIFQHESWEKNACKLYTWFKISFKKWSTL